jgi:hypothetical protein
MNTLSQKSMSSAPPDDVEEEVAIMGTSSRLSMGMSKLSSGIDSVSDQKVSSIRNSPEEVKLSSLANSSELPVLPPGWVIDEESVTDDETDRSGDTGAAATGTSSGTFLAPPRFGAAAAFCFFLLAAAAAGAWSCLCLVGSSRFLRCVCQTFLISLSVLPGSLAAMADHLRSRAHQRTA